MAAEELRAHAFDAFAPPYKKMLLLETAVTLPVARWREGVALCDEASASTATLSVEVPFTVALLRGTAATIAVAAAEAAVTCAADQAAALAAAATAIAACDAALQRAEAHGSLVPPSLEGDDAELCSIALTNEAARGLPPGAPMIVTGSEKVVSGAVIAVRLGAACLRAVAAAQARPHCAASAAVLAALLAPTVLRAAAALRPVHGSSVRFQPGHPMGIAFEPHTVIGVLPDAEAALSAALRDCLPALRADTPGLDRVRQAFAPGSQPELLLRSLPVRQAKGAETLRNTRENGDNVGTVYRKDGSVTRPSAAARDAGNQQCASPACSTREDFPGGFKRCGRCRAVVYCSPACQKVHWKAGHKRECVAPADDGEDQAVQ